MTHLPTPERPPTGTFLRRVRDAAGNQAWRVDEMSLFLTSPCAILEIEDILRRHPEAALTLCQTPLGRAVHKLVVRRS